MLKDDAKREMVRLWLSLPPDERRTEQQAAMFAMAHKDRFNFKASGDRYQVVKGWLLGHLHGL